MLIYPKDVLDKTARLVDEDKQAEVWLKNNKYEMLVKLVEAIVYRDSKAMEYLLMNKHFILAAFINAVWDDKKALNVLMDRKEYCWAAMANYINGDKNAGLFLSTNKLDAYLSLADTIQKKIQKLNDKNTNFFNSGPFKI